MINTQTDNRRFYLKKAKEALKRNNMYIFHFYMSCVEEEQRDIEIFEFSNVN